MHSNLHYELYRAEAADRARAPRPRRSPPAAPAPAAHPRQGRLRDRVAGQPARPRVGPARDRWRNPHQACPNARSPGRAVHYAAARWRSPDSTSGSRSSRSTDPRSASSPAIPTGNSANQSLAQATVPPRASDRGALPPRVAEEIYLFTAGCRPDDPRRRGGARPGRRLRRHPAGHRAPARQRHRASRSCCCAAARRPTRTRTPCSQLPPLQRVDRRALRAPRRRSRSATRGTGSPRSARPR